MASECSDERLKPYNGSCYLIVSYPEVDWWTAQQVCRGINTQLASISSPDEQRFITTNIRNNVDYSPRALYWLGGELAENREYEWTDGTGMSFQVSELLVYFKFFHAKDSLSNYFYYSPYIRIGLAT